MSSFYSKDDNDFDASGKARGDQAIDWEQGNAYDDEPLILRNEWVAVVASMLVHVIVFLALALVPINDREDDSVVVIATRPDYQLEEIERIEKVTYSDMPQIAVGASSTADNAMAEASAQTFAEISEIPNPVDLEPTELGQIMVKKMFDTAVSPLDKLMTQKGSVGEGTEGAAGAVDRITFEILQSMEERPTLVVWLFDQSGSLHRQRKEIRDRFDRIYEELGIVQSQQRQQEEQTKKAKRDNTDIPLLTSVIGFGDEVNLFTKQPTDDLAEIKSVVDNIKIDSSGIEKAFSAITAAIDEYKSLRRRRGSNPPQRNVLFIVVTDERGDDARLLESSISGCRKFGIPVYVIGVPAPFGREHTLVKYVDPDPKYDQSPQFAEVDQGPETFLPERVQVGFTGNFRREPVIDSGFGPYALTRLCYETGGIYFTVHPNRNTDRRVNRYELEPFASELQYFFDPVVMSRYRPDYLSPEDYSKQVKRSGLRQALVSAAQMRPAEGLLAPRTRFVRRDEAQLAGDLTRAQQDAAKLEPRLAQMAMVLEKGMSERKKEKNLRWKAGFDLALGRVLAQKVRTETYNAMLAQAKRGMPFKNAKNNTWILEPSDQISVGSKWQNQANLARELLTGVSNDHKGTPWALLASEELKVPLGWRWKEKYTNLDPPRPRRPGNNNNNPRPARDDQARMINKAPKRPVPKL
jgi:hypothetical protein